MEEIREVRLMLTKVSNSFKVVVVEKWLYTSKKALYGMLDGETTAVRFREIENTEK